MKRLIPVILVFVLVFTAFTAMAATKTQDGIEAELSLSKAEYAAGEKIDVTLKLKNTTSDSIENVTTEITLPNGMSASVGQLKQSAFTLAANESKTFSVTAVKGATSTAPSKTGTSSSSNSPSPQTGDESILLAAVIMIASGSALVYFVFKNKGTGKSFLSILLCVVLLGGCVLPTAVSADSAKKEITLEETFKLAGTSCTVKAVITYGGEASNNGASSENNSSNDSDNNGGDDTTAVVQKPVDTNPAGEEILGEGSEGTPYMEIPDANMTLTTVEIPAGGVLYYDIYRVGGMILTINDADAYVEYNGSRYDAQDGSVVIWLESALASDAVSFAFGNNGSTAKSFVIEFASPTGSYDNPTIVDTIGNDFQISLEEGNEVGYYYRYIAEQTGTLRFYITASVDSIIVVTNNRNSAQRNNEADVLVDENGNEYVGIEVEQGDELVIIVGAKPNKRGKYPATDITWNAKYY